MHVAERIRTGVEKQVFPDMEGRKITISIGIAGIPDKEIDGEDKLLRCADMALYRAKKTGRNRTEIGTGEDFSAL